MNKLRPRSVRNAHRSGFMGYGARRPTSWHEDGVDAGLWRLAVRPALDSVDIGRSASFMYTASDEFGNEIAETMARP